MFAGCHSSFWLPELFSVAQVCGIALNCDELQQQHNPQCPFLVIQLANDATAKALVSRCILVKHIIQLWAYGDNYTQLHEQLQPMVPALFNAFGQASFKFTFETFGNTLDQQKRIDIVNSFAYTGLQGPIVMSNVRIIVLPLS